MLARLAVDRATSSYVTAPSLPQTPPEQAMKPRRKKTNMTKNESNDSEQQKQLKELEFQVRRFVNLKLNPPESADEFKPALPPQKRSEQEIHRNALSGLTLLTARANFFDGLRRTNQDHPSRAAVEVKSPGFYQDPNTKLFLSEDGLAGAAISPGWRASL